MIEPDLRNDSVHSALADIFRIRNILFVIPEFEALVKKATEITIERVRSQTAAVYLLNKDGLLERVWISGVDRDRRPISLDWFSAEQVKPGGSFTGQVLSPVNEFGFGNPRCSNALERDGIDAENRTAFLSKLGALSSAIAVPLNGRFRTFGALEVINKFGPEGASARFENEDVYWVSMIGMTLATAISRLRLQEEHEVLAGASQMLLNAFSESAAHQQFYDFITQGLTGPTTNYKVAILRVGTTPESLQTVSRHGVNVSWESHESASTHLERGILGDVFTKKQPIIVRNLTSNSDRFQTASWIKANNLLSYASFPLVLRGEIQGSLSVFTGYEYTFYSDNVRFLSNIGALIASYLEGRRLSEQLVILHADVYRASEKMISAAEQIQIDRSPSSHHFKNVLVDIKGNLEPLVNELSSRQASTINAILENIDSELKKTVESIRVPVTPVQLNHIIGAVLKYFVAQLRSTGIRFKFEPLRDLPLVYASEAEMTEIVRNLISNAVKAIQKLERRDGLVRIGAELSHGTRIPTIDLWVEDNGIGIRKEEYDRIFARGFSTFQGGTGMGLFITQQIVENNYGGRVTPKSTGKGSIFTVSLPLKRLQVEE